MRVYVQNLKLQGFEISGVLFPNTNLFWNESKNIRGGNLGSKYPGWKLGVKISGVETWGENIRGGNLGWKYPGWKLGVKISGVETRGQKAWGWNILQPFPIAILQEFQNILLSLHFWKVIKISFRGFNHCTSLSDFVQIVWKLTF